MSCFECLSGVAPFTRNARARPDSFSRCFLRSEKFLLQNYAISRNAVRTSLPSVSSEKHAAQHLEKLRKRPVLNYKSAAPSNAARRRELNKRPVHDQRDSLLFGIREHRHLLPKPSVGFSLVITKWPIRNESLLDRLEVQLCSNTASNCSDKRSVCPLRLPGALSFSV
jgi:hypothetical protein